MGFFKKRNEDLASGKQSVNVNLSKNIQGLLKNTFPLLSVAILALITGFCADMVVHSFLVRYNIETKAEISLKGGSPLKGAGVDGGQPSLEDFVAANPFNSLKRNISEPVATAEKNIEEKVGIKDMSLIGTLPGIGVRIKFRDEVLFLLFGQSYGGYTLEEIKTDYAVFTDDQKEYLLPLLFGESQEKGKSDSSARARSDQRQVSNRSNGFAGQYNVTAPSEGKSGEVPRELVNNLLMNPFDELKKVRLQAKFDNDNPLGMQVQWISDDSILRELGVEKGDVVSSINGIPMSNMGDISNAINSLMGGTRFDVEVLRNGESVPLTYVVR